MLMSPSRFFSAETKSAAVNRVLIGVEDLGFALAKAGIEVRRAKLVSSVLGSSQPSTYRLN
jgi:hypothetical protein